MTTIKLAIKQLTAEAPTTLVGKVVSVDEQQRTVDVEPLNGDATLFEVRLQSLTGVNAGVCLLPKNGSDVIVQMANDVQGVVVATEQVDKVLVGIGNNTVEIDSEAVAVKAGLKEVVINSQGIVVAGAVSNLAADVDKLVSLLSTLMDTLMPAQVITPAGNGVLDPGTIAKLVQAKVEFEVVKARFKDYLKEA